MDREGIMKVSLDVRNFQFVCGQHLVVIISLLIEFNVYFLQVLERPEKLREIKG